MHDVKRWSFKERIHSMTHGHHHLSADKVKEICNQFPENFEEILDLQANPPKFRAERYVRNLTALVINSDTLTREQKHAFYRRSYEQAIQPKQDGAEWKGLLGVLVRRTDALSLDELEELLKKTSHEPLKPLIQKAIERKKSKKNLNARRKLTSSNLLNQTSESQEEIAAEATKPNFPSWLYWILGLMILGGLLFLWNDRKGSSA